MSSSHEKTKRQLVIIGFAWSLITLDALHSNIPQSILDPFHLFSQIVKVTQCHIRLRHLFFSKTSKNTILSQSLISWLRFHFSTENLWEVGMIRVLPLSPHKNAVRV